jgi:hypothetical protein
MMKSFKIPILATAALAAVACVAAGSASATTLAVTGVAKNSAVSLEASLAAGSSTIVRDTNQTSTETCTQSTMKGATESPFTGATVTATLSSLTFAGCSHKTTVIKPGKLHFAWTSGTNAVVSSSGMQVTTESTIFGISCTSNTGTGTTIGTLTGVKEGNATLDINAVITKGICGTYNWTGTYVITTPNIGAEN